MTTIMEALRLEHANVAKLLNLLEAQLDKGTAADLELVHAIGDYLNTYPNQFHHPKEDLIYHALLAAEPEVGAPLDDLESEHVELSERAEELAFAINSIQSGETPWGEWFTDLAMRFIEFYRQHMAKEETSYFPEAERILDAETFAHLESQVVATDPLFSHHDDHRLAFLRHHVRR